MMIADGALQPEVRRSPEAINASPLIPENFSETPGRVVRAPCFQIPLGPAISIARFPFSNRVWGIVSAGVDVGMGVGIAIS